MDSGPDFHVKWRIPDATFGLSSYDDDNLAKGYTCLKTNCTLDQGPQQPDQRLSKRQLRAMMLNRQCGLVPDGKWGKLDVVFPFAVYEAKRERLRYQAAKTQVFHACKLHMGMLDDLARNPENVSEYQSEDSTNYQVFGFSAEGAVWQVFLAFNFHHDCVSLSFR